MTVRGVRTVPVHTSRFNLTAIDNSQTRSEPRNPLAA